MAKKAKAAGFLPLSEIAAHEERTRGRIAELESRRDEINRELSALVGASQNGSTSNHSSVSITVGATPASWMLKPSALKMARGVKRQPAKRAAPKSRRGKPGLSDFLRRQVARRPVKVETLAKQARRAGYRSKNLPQVIRMTAARVPGLARTLDDKVKKSR